MDDLQKTRENEYRNWKRWDLVGVLTWLARFDVFRWILKDIPFRGQQFSRTPPRLESESPIVELCDLAEKGLVEAPVEQIKDEDDLRDIIALAAYVSERSDRVTQAETDKLNEMISTFSKGETDQTKLISHFSAQPEEIDSLLLKSSCYRLRSRLNQNQSKSLIGYLYDFAYLKSPNLQKARLITHIGEYLEVPSRDIRLAEADARRKTSNKATSQ